MADESAAQQTSQSSQGDATQSQSTNSAASGDASSQTQASNATTQATTQQAEPWAAAPPAFAKEFKTAKEFEEHYTKNVAPVLVRDAAEQVRRGSLPQKPEDYKVSTTQNFKPPEGVEFKLDENDPLWSQARAWAQKNGLSQDAFAEAIDLVAGSKVGEATTIKAAREAEINKLGAAGPARVTALETFFTGLLGADRGKTIMSMAVTAGIVEALEATVGKFSSQGSASFSQAHRETAQEAGKIPGIEKMNFKQARAAQDEWAARQKTN